MLREERKWIHIICSIKVKKAKNEGKKKRNTKYNKQKTVINAVNIKTMISVITKYEWSIHELKDRDYQNG